MLYLGIQSEFRGRSHGSMLAFKEGFFRWYFRLGLSIADDRF